MFRKENSSVQAAPPWLTSPEGWMSTRQMAEIYKRSPRTIQEWCSSGSILEFGFEMYRDLKGRFWLRLRKS
jgi:hypothetical protein